MICKHQSVLRIQRIFTPALLYNSVSSKNHARLAGEEKAKTRASTLTALSR